MNGEENLSFFSKTRNQKKFQPFKKTSLEITPKTRKFIAWNGGKKNKNKARQRKILGGIISTEQSFFRVKIYTCIYFSGVKVRSKKKKKFKWHVSLNREITKLFSYRKKKEIFIPIPARVLNVAISFSGGICGPRILI